MEGPVNFEGSLNLTLKNHEMCVSFTNLAIFWSDTQRSIFSYAWVDVNSNIRGVIVLSVFCRSYSRNSLVQQSIFEIPRPFQSNAILIIIVYINVRKIRYVAYRKVYSCLHSSIFISLNLWQIFIMASWHSHFVVWNVFNIILSFYF